MIATAIAGMAMGPWAGAFVGILINLIAGAKFDVYLKFTHVNALCGVLWGVIPMLMPIESAAISKSSIVVYILCVGASVGLIFAILAVPIRMLLGFKTSHILDQVGHYRGRPLLSHGNKTAGRSHRAHLQQHDRAVVRILLCCARVRFQIPEREAKNYARIR